MSESEQNEQPERDTALVVALRYGSSPNSDDKDEMTASELAEKIRNLKATNY